MQRVFFFLFIILASSTSLFAQSKKQLQQQLNALEEKYKADSSYWAEQAAEHQTIHTQLQLENKKLKEEIAAQQTAYKALQNQQQAVLEKARNRVEVYDVYSLGMVPLRNNVGQYGRTILQMRDELNRQRWADVEFLSVQLRSPHVSFEHKTSLFSYFQRIYGNDLASYSIQDFQQHPLPNKLQKDVKKIINDKTVNELAQSLIENLWLQSLDPLWRDDALLFMPQITSWLNR